MLRRKQYVQPFGDDSDNKAYALEDAIMKSYLATLPGPEDMSQLTFWQGDVLNEVDSQHVKETYTKAHKMYNGIFQQLTDGEGSPYEGKGSITYEEFLWAFNIV